MKLITRNAGYVIRALMYMAKREGSVVSVNELVSKTHIPRAFLRRLLQVLNKNKILKSLKGKGGGFSLGVSPAEIRIVDIIKIFQKDTSIINCVLRKSICPNIKTCPLRKKIKEIEAYVLGQLRSITIASLLDA